MNNFQMYLYLYMYCGDAPGGRNATSDVVDRRLRPEGDGWLMSHHSETALSVPLVALTLCTRLPPVVVNVRSSTKCSSRAQCVVFLRERLRPGTGIGEFGSSSVTPEISRFRVWLVFSIDSIVSLRCLSDAPVVAVVPVSIRCLFTSMVGGSGCQLGSGGGDLGSTSGGGGGGLDAAAAVIFLTRAAVSD